MFVTKDKLKTSLAFNGAQPSPAGRATLPRAVQQNLAPVSANAYPMV
jgi:hypothetical protein